MFGWVLFLVRNVLFFLWLVCVVVVVLVCILVCLLFMKVWMVVVVLVFVIFGWFLFRLVLIVLNNEVILMLFFSCVSDGLIEYELIICDILM